jgi:CubicO group peptidase (beta-lactamase class C family)
MKVPRRNFLHLAAGAAMLPVLSASSFVLAQRVPSPASMPLPSESERAAMSNLALVFMEKYDVPALSIAVGYAGAIVYQDAFGLADREGREPVTPMHAFRIASVSKTITSAAIFTLIEQSRLQLSDRIFGPGAITGTDYGAQPYSPGVNQITLEHLLTHTAGGWANDTHDPMGSNPTMNHAELIAWTLKNRPLDNPPGQRFAYSNFGYCILGRLIEKITGKPYADYVRDTVLKRCGISEMSIAGNTLAQRQPKEVKYYAQEGNGRWQPYGMNVTRMDSHGGWIARPTDIVQYLMHVDGFTAPPNILQPQTIRAMTKGSTANPYYAKGWFVDYNDDWWHDGSLPGTSAIAERAHSGFCWAALANTRRAKIDGDLAALNRNMISQIESWRS